MRVYIAGPMTGIPDNNFTAFDAMANAFAALDHAVENPAEIARRVRAHYINEFHGVPTRADYLRADFRALLTCDAIYLLPGWEASEGALLEYEIAKALGMQVMHE